jgi:peptide/nickel transport system substrate-binding protein
MMRIRKLLMVALGVMLMVTLSASYAPAAKKAKRSFAFADLISNFGCRVGLDPSTGFMAANETTTGHLIFEGLVYKDVKGAYVPMLAKSWKVGPNWAYIDFTLQEGIKFHNGEDFTAEDVKFSLERYLRKDLQWVFRATLERKLDRIEIVDDYHVRLYCKEPFPEFFDLNSRFLRMLPKDYIKKVGDKKFAHQPVGTGPCKLTDYEHAQRIELEAVDNHWRKTPDFKTYLQVVATDSATRFAMLKTGEIDMAALAGIMIKQVRDDPDLRIILPRLCYGSSLAMVDVAYDEPSIWKDERVRKATSLAIDREGILKNIGYSTGELWGDFLPSYCLGYDPSVKPTPYNPERARKLLAEAGYPDGFKFEFLGHKDQKAAMEVMAGNWRDVGIKAKLTVVDIGDWSRRVTSLKERNIVIYLPSPWWSGGVEPSVAFMDMQTNWAAVPIPDWFREGYTRTTRAISDKEKAETGRELSRLIRESGIWTLLYAGGSPLGVGPRVESYEPVVGNYCPFRFEYLKLKRK